MDMLIDLIVVIISKSIRTSKHHTVHSKIHNLLFLNYTSTKVGKKCGKVRQKCQSDVVGDRSYCPLLASKMKGRRKTGNGGSHQKWKIPR